MDAEQDLAEIVTAVAKADRGAFRVLYDRVGGKLFGICLRICRERPLAEEALQETLLEIWRRAGSFDIRRGAPESWMSVIARHRAIDVLRRQVRRPAPVSVGDEADAISVADPAAPTDGGVERLALWYCLERLEAEQRHAVLLAYNDGYSREELAEWFSAPVNTIKSRLRRALQLLRECLEDSDG